MKTISELNPIPSNYGYCMNGQCERSAECLRYTLLSRAPSEHAYISILNPACYASDGKPCHHFMPDKLVQFALGVTHLLDNVPYNKALEIKKELMAYFNYRTYYRCRKKERLITPGEQQYIRKLFRSKGITEEPLFDEYVEGYEWR